ncbi:MAG: prolipoprotein diacylglyceryl transferase [Candidatus Villigracilaceae bacterium]
MPVGFSVPVIYVQVIAFGMALIGLVSVLVAAFRHAEPVNVTDLLGWLALGLLVIGSFFFVEDSASISVRYYGIIIMLGAVAGGLLSAWELKRLGHDPQMVTDLMVWLVVGGIVGARLWHVFTPSPSALIPDPSSGKMVNPYFVGGRVHLWGILTIWKGGLGIPGAVIGGLIALFFFCRKYHQSFAFWVDIGAPALALGQAIGRWGNFFNEELYGAPTDLPWRLYISPDKRLPGFLNVEYYHPLFLYESLWNLANMFLLLWLRRRFLERLKPGDVFLVYLITYPTGRFLIDFLRLDASRVAGININQTIMGVVAICAAVALIWRHRRNSRANVEPASD